MEINQQRQCWCRGDNFVEFSPEYSLCANCQTLVSQLDLQDNFYNKDYWLSHQSADLGSVDIHQRARLDLPERCLYWLRTVLKYKLPLAKVLELGSSHGGFVAMLNWAGYEATGLELDSWVADFAKNTFEVPMLVGSIEKQNISNNSLDMIILMDVLEHLPDPVTTLRKCFDLLKEDGIIIVQTPKFPIKTCKDLQKEKHRFLEMMIPDEHLYLFSENSIKQFFKNLGAEYIAFEPAIFAHYDMFFVVSRKPFETYAQQEITETLEKVPTGRLLLALEEMEREQHSKYCELIYHQQQLAVLQKNLEESELDRENRLTVINKQLEHIQYLSQLWSVRIASYITKFFFWKKQKLTRMEEPKKTIAIDLIPMLPGGENGGLKLMIIELIKHMSVPAPNKQFVLLTSVKCHDELAYLDGENVRRMCVDQPAGEGITPKISLFKKIISKIKMLLPVWFKQRLLWQLQKAKTRFVKNSFLDELGVDLLFCPFAVSQYYDPAIPMVSVICDLQYISYPQFFSAEEFYHRDKSFKTVCKFATKIVCISDYVRQTVLKNAEVNVDKVVTAHIRLVDRLDRPSKEKITLTLEKFNLENESFLFYPANFWQHKNHAMLLTAFGMYKAKYTKSNLKLVFTGAPDKRMQYIQHAVKKMRMEEQVVFAGYLTNDEFSCLMSSCRAVIFPSLYEGFGMPILEAMSFGKPVLCSNVTSLPEVAGEAALYFDPKKPNEIVNVIEQIEMNPVKLNQLVQCGFERLKYFNNSQEMAEQYLHIFQQCKEKSEETLNQVHGIHEDGWASNKLVITHDASLEKRAIEIELSVPEFVPMKKIEIDVVGGTHKGAKKYSVRRGNTLNIHEELSFDNGSIEVYITPAFQPKAHRLSEDQRFLSTLCHRCEIIYPDKTIELFTKN